MSPDPRKVQAQTAMSPLKTIPESFLGILNYLCRSSLMITDVCEPLWKADMSKDRLNMEWDVPRGI